MKKTTKTQATTTPSPVIIATIGYEKFCLNSFEDGETLLKLISNAQHVEDHHHLPVQKRYYKSTRTGNLEVSLVCSEILEESEAKELIDAKNAA